MELPYLDLSQDLNKTPRYIFSQKTQAKLALQHGIQLHQKKTGFMQVDTTNAKYNLIVYVDKQNKAHWAFHVAFLGGTSNGTTSCSYIHS